MILKIDEINKRSIPYKKYFGIMKLSEKQISDRIAFAEMLEDHLLYIMTLFDTLSEYNVAESDLVVQQLRQAYIDTATSFGVVSDDYITEIALVFAVDFVRATLEHTDDKWYRSEDRIKFNAENESNTVLNYKDYTEAINKGYHNKTWLTENDTRVRPTHVPLEGETIPIHEYFVVGDSLMAYPRDLSLDPDPNEVVNCRCSISYS